MMVRQSDIYMWDRQATICNFASTELVSLKPSGTVLLIDSSHCVAASLSQEIRPVTVGARDRTPSITAWWSHARKHCEAIDSGQLDRGVATSDNLASRSVGVCWGRWMGDCRKKV